MYLLSVSTPLSLTYLKRTFAIQQDRTSFRSLASGESKIIIRRVTSLYGVIMLTVCLISEHFNEFL